MPLLLFVFPPITAAEIGFGVTGIGIAACISVVGGVSGAGTGTGGIGCGA